MLQINVQQKHLMIPVYLCIHLDGSFGDEYCRQLDRDKVHSKSAKIIGIRHRTVCQALFDDMERR